MILEKTAVLQNADASLDADGIIDSADDVIEYSISLTNTEATSFANPVVTDPFLADALDKNDDGVVNLLDAEAGSDANANGLLDPGETFVWKASYTVTQDDIDSRGNYDSPVDSDGFNDSLMRNVASVATDNGPTRDGEVDTLIDYDPQLRVTKTDDVFNEDGSDDLDEVVDVAGDVIRYSITVENIGNVTLTNLVLTDALVNQSLDKNGDGVINAEDATGDLDADGELDVDESWSFSGEYVVTQSDINNRGNYDGPDLDALNDNAIVNVTSVTTSALTQSVAGAGDVYTEIDFRPLVDVAKTAEVRNADGSLDSDNAVDTAGDVINYTLSLTNIGNVTLTDALISDPLVASSADKNADGVINAEDIVSGDTNGDDIFDIGETWVFTGQYVVQQADLDAGGNYDGADPDSLNDNIIRNFAGGTFNAGGQQVTRDAFVDTALAVSPSLSISKSANVTSVDSAGDDIVYTITVQNTGNITLTNVVVTDPLTGLSQTIDSLSPGDSSSFEVTYDVKQIDFDSNGGGDGDIDNTATADSDQTDAVTADASVDLVFVPELTITKTANVSSVDEAGDDIVYTVEVENTGNVTLTNLLVTDPMTGLSETVASLAPGAVVSFDRLYEATQGDFDTNGGGDGDIDNTATADSDQTDAVDASATVALVYSPSLTISKSANVASVDAAGDEIVYTVSVQNTGNVTLTNLIVTDPMTGLSETITSLAPGDSSSFEVAYTATQGDFDSNGGGDGDIDNTATADSDETDAVQASASVDLITSASLGISKSANVASVDQAGDNIVYTVTVQNNGNVTLTNLVVNDPMTGLSETIVSLAPGASSSFDTTYQATQADFDTNGGGDGDIDNTATADSDQTGAVQASAEVDVLYDPDLSIEKMADVQSVDEVGDLINYTITVSNTGNITLDGVMLSDDLIAASLDNDSDDNGVIDGDDGDGLLEVGESWTWTGQYMVTQADLDMANASSDNPYLLRNTATVDTDQTDPESATETVEIMKAVFEGLSPGYWKNTPEDWDGIALNQSFEDFFFGGQNDDIDWTVKTSQRGRDKFQTVDDIRFMQALELTGGDAAALARGAVAAILNARDEDVTYRFTEDQIKAWVEAALTGEDLDLDGDGNTDFEGGDDAVEGLKDLFDYNNNLELM
jgi:uncharacterized repeat protein (TIGR01451 family)